MGQVAVMGEFDLAKQVKAHQGKDYYPYCQINLASKYVPMIGLIWNDKEFHSQCEYDEAQDHFYGIEPAA